MKNNVLLLQQIVSFLIFLFSIVPMAIAMEKENLPVCIHKLYDPISKTKDESLIKIIITPDQKHVVLAKKDGIVSCFSLENKKEERLMHFAGVKHIPMLAVATRKGSLIVVAAGNYFNKETKIDESEYGVWHKGYLKTGTLAPLQAITIDKEGKFLVIVNKLQTVGVINLNTYSLITKSIWLKTKYEHDIDIVCSSGGNIIIIAKTKSMTLMNWSGTQLELLNKQIPCNDNIKHVYLLPQSDALIYTTSENQVKKLEIDQIFNHTDNSKPILLFEAFFNGKVVIDGDVGNVAALWAKDKKATEMTRNQITIKKIEKADKDLFLCLTMPLKDQKYDYLSKQGFVKWGYNYLRTVALRGNSIVAITADGKLCWWDIELNDKKDYSSKDLLCKIIEDIDKGSIKNTKKPFAKVTFITPIPKIVLSSPRATPSDCITKNSRSQSDGSIPSPRKTLSSNSSSRDSSRSPRKENNKKDENQ